jgi:hypothetical protein
VGGEREQNAKNEADPKRSRNTPTESDNRGRARRKNWRMGNRKILDTQASGDLIVENAVSDRSRYTQQDDFGSIHRRPADCLKQTRRRRLAARGYASELSFKRYYRRAVRQSTPTLACPGPHVFDAKLPGWLKFRGID